jgi:predicted alpha/beta-fold hydrolase
MPVDFRPLPLLGNPHLQTLLGNALRGPRVGFPTREHAVQLPDGDQVVLHDTVPARWRKGERIALLVHGLGGTHNSGYMNRMTGRLVPRGVRVLRMDLRGCGRGMSLARRPYHGGCSADVRAAVEEIGRWSPASPIVLVGFSLGGNIALKLAGEAADTPLANLAAVAAVSPPIDLEQCAAILAKPRNRLYELYYLRGLMAQVRQRQAVFPEDARVQFPRRMTMRLFDGLYTAPRCGFDSALHYYRRASSAALVPRIRVPAWILSARDDPFVVVEPLDALAPPRHIKLTIVNRGGHLGFLGRNETGGIRWAEQQIADWVLACGEERHHHISAIK